MNSLRPNTSELYIERSRLLNRLPEEAGYVVWLEAPYGYGKSVLAMHWADLLEKEDWRIIWLSLEGRDAKTTIGDALGLPNFVPWGVVLDALWEQPTLLVLEDLTGEEELSPVLKHVQGLVLLASRKLLTYSELPHLLTEQKLQHVTAKQLAFSEDEAKQLFVDQAQASDYWQQTRGWSLPLHFASLTGEAPEQKSLLAGMQASISAEAWQEALFLTALASLPKDASTQATEELVKTGFAQSLENAYRLHPMVAENILNSFAVDIKKTVIAQAERLTPLARGEAFEGVDHIEGLVSLLDTLEHELCATNPIKVLHWHSLIVNTTSTSPTPEYLANLAVAQLQATQVEKGLETVRGIIEKSNISSNIKLYVLGVSIYILSNLGRLDEAKNYLDLTEGLKEPISNYYKGLFSSHRAQFYLRSNDNALAKKSFEEGIEFLSALVDNPRAKKTLFLLKTNLFTLSSERGEIQHSLKEYQNILDTEEANLSQVVLGNVHFNIAIASMTLNDLTTTRKHLPFILENTTGFLKLFATIFEAYINKDIAKLTSLNEQAKRWNNNDISHRTSAILLRAMRSKDVHKYAQTAFDLSDSITSGHHTEIEYAYFENAIGNKSKAEALLTRSKNDGNFVDIDHKYVWFAAHFIIMQDESSLDALLNMSTARDLLFHYLLIPLDALPKHRPELSRTYPLKEVLYSDWQEAIQYRLNDGLPSLGINLLGEFNVLLLGDSIELTDRLKQILCLLALGKSRDEVAAAMWPEADVKKSRNNLNVQFNLLRKAIEPWGISSYLFEEGLRNISVDYQDLIAAIKTNDIDTVLSLYQEPFAAGLYLDAIEETREQIKQDVIEFLFRKTDTGANSDEAKIRLYLEKILELEPTHEEALQHLLKILMKNGRRREANKRFQYFSEQLEKEMGLEPLPSTKAILES